MNTSPRFTISAYVLIPSPRAIRQPRPLLLFKNKSKRSRIIRHFLKNVPFAIVLLEDELPQGPRTRGVDSCFVPSQRCRASIFRLCLLFKNSNVCMICPSIRLRSYFTTSYRVFIFNFPITYCVTFYPLHRFKSDFRTFRSANNLSSGLCKATRRIIIP